MVFKVLKNKGQHEQIIFCNDTHSGLKAIIAIHNTHLGLALGGCRMWPYETEEEALNDVLNLSKAMSYKAAITGCNLGGGKSIIIGDPDTDKTPELFRQFGRFIESLNGRYITAKDVGVDEKDLHYVGEETKHVIGLPKSEGGAGDPSYYTALGVYHGIKQAVKWKFKTESLQGLKIAVQGAGHVGYCLLKLLDKEGAEFIISDIKKERVKQIQSEFSSVKPVSPEDIFSVSCDVFSPCALGGQISKENLKNLKTQIIAGAANNQLADKEMDDFLFQNNILYVPDFVINSGGLIYVNSRIESQSISWVEEKIQKTRFIISEIFKKSEKDKMPTEVIALNIAKKRIKEEGKSSFYIR